METTSFSINNHLGEDSITSGIILGYHMILECTPRVKEDGVKGVESLLVLLCFVIRGDGHFKKLILPRAWKGPSQMVCKKTWR